ncbi:diacylglycerol/lipid kinase family protein [Ancylobacter pratisalsi]|uniref:Diacylglycerol kinase n=1 Tax=Ancylobacter pratisalsi TaxID=1745854 RepID=A0A6P1YH51_9HYPH|nr:diacylglycerol kinase family protein [Ancylobacter pratisalsi]QIB32617.1 diacylglycerol kinase [Ancylobacter pratisalsi]
MKNTIALLNADAGTLLDRNAEEVRALVERGLGGGGRTVEVHLLRGKNFLRAIRASGNGPHDTVVVGGGDGSVSLAVRSLHGSGKVLGILPLGTLNLLARDIGMPVDLDQAIAALSTAEPGEVDLATLNDRIFHTISGMGFFSQMARAREMARKLKLWRFVAVALAAFYALRRSGRFELDVTVDGETRHFDALAALVSVNRFSGPGWHRGRLDEGVLEVHIVEERGALARLKAGADMVNDTWRNNPEIISLTGQEIVLRRPNRSRCWVSTDGELDRENVPLTYRIKPAALAVLRPRPPAG